MSSSPATIYSDMAHAVGGFLLTVARQWMTSTVVYTSACYTVYVHLQCSCVL